LVFQEHGTQVAVVTEDDRVNLKKITVSKLMDQIVEVADGLSANDRIINNPNAALMNGNKVRVVTPEPGYDVMNVPEPMHAPGHDQIKSEKPASPSQEASAKTFPTDR
jgi:hypothetical protein